MPEKSLADRISDIMLYSLDLKKEESLLIFSTAGMHEVSDLIIEAKIGMPDANFTTVDYGPHKLKIYENENIKAYEFVLGGDMPFNESALGSLAQVLEDYKDIRGCIGLFGKAETQTPFRVKVTEFFKAREFRYAHIPGMDAKTLIDQWNRLLPDNVQEWIERVNTGRKILTQENLVGLHFEGKNGTDYVHFLNEDTGWRDDILWTKGDLVQWPMGELFDEKNVYHPDMKGNVLMKRKGYGVWVGDFGVGGFHYSLKERNAFARLYIGMGPETDTPQANDLGTLITIKGQDNGKTFEIPASALGVSPLHYDGLAKSIYDELLETRFQPPKYPIIVQEVAIGFNEYANPSSPDVLESEKSGPHLAIGGLDTHIDFVTERSISVTGLVLKKEYRTEKPNKIEEFLMDKPNWDLYFDKVPIYSQGDFAKN